MTSGGSSFKIPLLKKYFAVVQDLRSYLTDILEPQDGGTGAGAFFDFCPRDSDTVAYRDLVNTSYVALKSADSSKSRLKVFPAMVDMHEIIDRAQEKLFKATKGSQDIITAGYRMASKDGDRGKKGMIRVGITNHFVNTIITALQGPEWNMLLQRVGVDVMIHLLTETFMFISLPNDCLCQMTGEPLIHMVPTSREMTEDTEPQPIALNKRSHPFEHDKQDERPTKRTKLDTQNQVDAISSAPGIDSKTSGSPVDISLIRSRMFYARPSLVPHIHSIVVGLPAEHIFNRLNPAYLYKPLVEPGQYVDPDPKKQAEHARHIAKYVFPRQFGLTNPFTTNYFKRATKSPEYLDREAEIKAQGPVRTPKRLKEILCLIDKMFWRHGKCGYKPLRDKACPSKLASTAHTTSKPIDSSIILELMSEHSIQLRSQKSMGIENTSIDSFGNSIAPYDHTQAERHARNKPRFIEFSCSHVEVYCYVALVTKAVIPKSFWGSESNFRLILRHVKAFISCRRFETLTLHHILQGFSTSMCNWLMPPGSGAKKQTRVSVSDALKRRELLEEFILWYFDSFVQPLLKATFYITESSAFKNRVLYFRQDDWESLCAPLIERLTASTFEKISELEAQEILRQRKLGFSFVRLLPKDTGVRPIVNLRRRKPVQKGAYGYQQSINQILQAAFQILTYEKQNQPHLLGASIFSPDEAYSKLKRFKSRLPRSPDGSLPTLYFVKVDVQACFDTIEQSKLLEILRQLISEDVYMIRRHGQVDISSGRIKRTYVKKAVPDDEHVHFLQYATQLANGLRNTLFVDQVIYPYAQKKDILQLLEEHITENIVKIGQDYYRQMIGIPQGSVMSSLLCSFFYGNLEKRFGSFTDDLQSTLLRMIDDYLFITTSLPNARGFLDMMNKGHPEYGCFISKEKTLTNFDYDSQILNVTEPQQRSFPWCGYLINMKDLSVSPDYSRYNGTSLLNSLTVDRGRRPGVTFTYKMLQLAKAKSHIIFADDELNTQHVVYLNIYQNFLLCAMKMDGYLRVWGVGSKKNATFISHTVQKMINFTFASIRNKAATSRVANANGGRCNINKLAVTWLGTHAFHAVLSRKSQRYASLIKPFAFELSRPRHRRFRGQFSELIKEGRAGFAQVVL